MKTALITSRVSSSQLSSSDTSSTKTNEEKTSTTLTLYTTSKNEKKSSEKSGDEWLGIATKKTRGIDGTPYFLSRVSPAVVPSQQEVRQNAHGYDMDDPKDAIAKYEAKHPKSWGKKAWHACTDTIFNISTAGIPALLSASAGNNKQRIDQKLVLRIVRESVDKFPELKIRIAKEAYDRLDVADQRLWHKNMETIRACQHDYIVNELSKAYPHHINLEAPTILYSGGRAAGLLRVLYCSLDEYVALYWSDWGLMSTDSGSYRAHVYDYITEGHNVNWNAHYLDFKTTDYETTEPGEYTFLGEDDRKIWSFEGPCGMVDHGIGDIPSMLKFAAVSNITTTLNLHAIGTLLIAQTKALAHEYIQRLKETFGVTETPESPLLRVTENELQEAQGYFAKILERVK